jgi:putative transposase
VLGLDDVPAAARPWETGDRRHATHPARVKPELLATKPNQVWSWDRTKLAGPAKWTWFYLSTILDIFSRSVVGWMVAAREAASLAERLLADLGVMRSHGRPHVPDDNPYSQSQFKTLKHHPTFPDRFGCIQDARAFCREFFGWYNAEHRHWGIGLLTPADVHSGRAAQITVARGAVLDAAYAAHRERFVGKPPQPPRPPEQVWINKPIDPTEPPQQFPG